MLTLIGCWKTFVSRCRFSLYMIYYLHNSCSGLSMNVGRCLRRKWLNLGIMNGKIFTNRGMLIIDMTLNLSGYALFDRQHSIIFSSGIFFFSNYCWIDCWFGWNVLSGEEERLLVALYCFQGFKGVHSKTFTWIRRSYFSGGWGSEIVKKLRNLNIIYNWLT